MLELFETEWCQSSSRVRERLTELGPDYVNRQVPVEREERTHRAHRKRPRFRDLSEVERAGIEPATSGLQTQPIGRPHLTVTDRTGKAKQKSVLSANLAPPRLTAVRSHRTRTGAAWTGNDSGSQQWAWDRTDDLRRTGWIRHSGADPS
jgi:hypothetical protein